MPQKNNRQILEGSHAIALTIKNIAPAVISAYPITPQTHIVEDLAKFKADGEASYEFLRAESEFAAASIVLGSSATGVRVYTATSSQGLLLMAEVVYNIAGMRLPIVMTCANRAISAPISIWNDQQDVHAVSNAGWILLFAENSQEAVDQHIMAYKIAEKTSLPVMVNVDGFTMTHVYEPVAIHSKEKIKKYLGEYKPTKKTFLDPENPITMGALVGPASYMEIREDLHNDLIASLDVIKKEHTNFIKAFKTSENVIAAKGMGILDNGLFEYYGPANPNIVLVAMGSVAGTIKETIDEINEKKSPFTPFTKGGNRVGILKIKCYRPFPAQEIKKILKNVKYIAVVDKAISPGFSGPLANDIRAALQGYKNIIKSFIVGLGGRDITKKIIKEVIKETQTKKEETIFKGK